MNVLLFSVLLLTSGMSYAASSEESLDIAEYSKDIKPLTTADLSWRLHITGEVFYVTADGEKLIGSGNEQREWEFNGSVEKPLIANWSFKQAGLPALALTQKWSLEKEGQLSVVIQQYESMDRDSSGTGVTRGKLVREEKILVKDFAAISWPIKAGDKKMVVRLVPGLWSDSPAIEAAQMPVSVKNAIISDPKGDVWADFVQPDHPSTYLGFVTHRGSLFVSFSPFKGSTYLGDAKRNRIRLKTPQGKITIFSETPIVPNGVVAKVYGVIDYANRTERLNSYKTYSSDKEDEFVKRIAH